MRALIRAVRAFTNHNDSVERTEQSATHVLEFRRPRRPRFTIACILSLFLRSRGPRRFVLSGKNALLDARSLAQFALHIC